MSRNRTTPKTFAHKNTANSTLTFGYCLCCEDKAAREECQLIKTTAEARELAVHEETSEGVLLFNIQACTAHMMELVNQLSELDLMKQTSLELPNKRTMLQFSNIARMGEVVFHHQGYTYVAIPPDQPEGFKPRISCARENELATV